MSHLFTKQISAKNAFIFVLTCCLLYILPIILADVYYRDDVERAINPAAGWFILGRPGADIVMRFFTFNLFEISDTAPLTLLLAGLFISWVIWSVAVKTEKELSIGSVAPYVLLFISPFFLQNISYKYDSLPMTLGLGLSILAFFYPQNKGVKSYLVPIALLFGALTLYQPCSNIFIGLYGVNLLVGFKKDSDQPLKDTLWAGSVLLGAYVLYFVIIHKMFGLDGGRGGMIPLSEAGHYLWKDIKGIIRFIRFAMSLELKIITCLAALGVIYTFVCHIDRFLRGKTFDTKTILSLLLILFSPIVIFISFLGPLFLLKEGITDVRVLPGFSATLFLFSYSLSFALIKLRPKLSFFALIPVFYFVALSFQYGNAVKNQRIHEERIFSWLSYDLLTIQANTHGKIFITNYPSTSPMTQRILDHQSLIDLMYSPAYGWISRRMMYSIGFNNIDLSWEDDYNDLLGGICGNNVPPIKDNKFYTIYPSGDNTIVWFKNRFKGICGAKPGG